MRVRVARRVAAFFVDGGGGAAATPVETGVMDVSLCSGGMALAAAARLEALASSAACSGCVSGHTSAIEQKKQESQ